MGLTGTVVWIGSFILLVASGAALGAPLTFETQPPVPEGTIAVAQRTSFSIAGDGPAPENADETVLLLTTMVTATPVRHLALAAAVDIVWRDASLSSPTGDRVNRSALGLGDLTLFASSPLPTHWLRGHLVAAPFVSLKLPTGSDNQSDDLGRLPQRLQVGTGALDAGGGLVASFSRGALGLHGAATYVFRSRANDFDAGDTARLDLAAHHIVSGHPGDANRIAVALEGRALFSAADSGPLAPAESGGFSAFVSPGVQAKRGRQTLELALEIPLTQPSDQHVDVIVRAGYRLRVN